MVLPIFPFILSADRQTYQSLTMVLKGIVYKSTGSWYTVRDETGKFWNARMKGIFKIDEITSTNPVSVGDEVEIEKENENQHRRSLSYGQNS